MEFYTEHDDEGSVVIIRPKGRLTMVSTPELRSLVADTIEGGRLHIVIDLSATEFIDSSGLGGLLAARRVAQEAGGDVRIACPTEQVEMVLRLTNVDRLMEMYRSVETAVGAA